MLLHIQYSIHCCDLRTRKRRWSGTMMKIASFQVDSHDMIFDNFAAIIIRHFAVSPNFVYKMLVIESAGSRNFFLPQVYFTMPGIGLVMGPSPGIGKAIAYRLSRDTFNLAIHAMSRRRVMSDKWLMML